MYDSVWKKNLCLHVKKPIILLNWAEMVFFSSDDLPFKAQFRSWPFDPIGQIRNEHYKERKKIVNFKEIFLKNFCLKIKKGLLFFKSDPNSARRVQLNSWIAETKEGMSAQITLGSDHLLSIINEELEGSNQLGTYFFDDISLSRHQNSSFFFQDLP